MGRIRILSDAVANKIAAGEVVERPASVAKELLENSLDAGATDVRIETEGGGRRLLRITDNGTGMLRDDALLAFERHATSKLRDPQDLLSIATLGFRGEALPSIASVSRLLLETRAREESTGTAIEIAGGKLLRCDEAALAGGTVISVRDLFFNVPARKKFLRSEQTELAHIASLVTHYSLAHPDKSFLLRHERTELLNVTPVPALRDRVYQVFGKQTLDELIELVEREQNGFRLCGFISQPQVQKLNRNSVYLFVNGRLIRDKLLMHALTSAYYNIIPPGTYPFALLFLVCDPGEVDVNVHPSKTEVRFHQSTVVHDFVRDTLRETLIERRPVSRLPLLSEEAQPAARLPYSEFSQRIENERFEQQSMDPALLLSMADLPNVTVSAPPPGPAYTPPSAPAPPPRLDLRVPDTHGALPDSAWMPESDSLDSLRDLRPLGQLHDSFIIAAARDGLWIIDQHVAHERILFEQVLKARDTGRVEQQRLLMPIVLSVTAAQQIQYARIGEELSAVGFETEPFGHRTIAVKSVPAGIGTADVEKLLFEILDVAENELRHTSLEELRRAIAASLACRAAIKINTRLDAAKIDWLLSALALTEYPMSCPHGRPIALRYGTRDILRGFHRI